MSDEGWASNNEAIDKDKDGDLVNGNQPSTSNTSVVCHQNQKVDILKLCNL